MKMDSMNKTNKTLEEFTEHVLIRLPPAENAPWFPSLLGEISQQYVDGWTVADVVD